MISARLIPCGQKLLWYEKATYFARIKPVFVKCRVWWNGDWDVPCGEEDKERRRGSWAIKHREKSRIV